MSAARVFVAECSLCHTKFTEPLAECPVCGGVSIRAIRESVPSPAAIPDPSRRKTPPPKVPRRPAPAAAPFPAVARRTPPRGTDGRFLPRKKAATPPVAADARLRLEAARTELREATRAFFAASRRKSDAEAAVRNIRAEIRREVIAARDSMRAMRAKPHGKARRKGGLHAVLDAIAGLLTVFTLVLGK